MTSTAAHNRLLTTAYQLVAYYTSADLVISKIGEKQRIAYRTTGKSLKIAYRTIDAAGLPDLILVTARTSSSGGQANLTLMIVIWVAKAVRSTFRVHVLPL